MITFPPDFSFYIQAISFLLLVAALRELLFTPVLRVLDERDKRTTGMRAQAAELTADSEASAAQHAARISDVRKALVGESEAIRSDISKEERAIRSAAQSDSSSYLTTQRATLRADADAAREVLAKDAGDIAASIAERVLGRNAG